MKKHVLLFVILAIACAPADKKADVIKDSDPTIAALQDSIANDSTNWQLRARLSDELRLKSRLDEAQKAAEKAFALAPSPSTEARLVMAKVYAAQDKSASAINLVKEVEQKKRDGNEPADEVKIAEVYAVLGDTSAVFRWLDRARVANSPNIVTIDTNKDFTGYHADSRWLGKK